MSRRMSRVIAGLLLLLAAGFARTAPILVVDGNGILTGARNVDVGGVLYDVDFRDGTCVALFGGCDNPVADFGFSDQSSASAAASALLNQVFIDGSPPALYDTNGGLTMGCTGQSEPGACAVFTPWGLREEDVLTEAVSNTPVESSDAVTAGVNFGKTLDTGTILNWTWAIWSPAAQQEGTASEPPTSACLLLAAGLAFAMSRRRKRNTSIQ